MPGFDGTGPQGRGPRTGGCRGFCPPGRQPFGGYGPGRDGFRRRGAGGRFFGGSRGRGWWRMGRQDYYTASPYGTGEEYAEQSVAQELELLNDQAARLEQELQHIHKRIEDLSRKQEQ